MIRTDTPSAPSLVSASDTGLSNFDDDTSDTTPTITGLASPGALVVLYDGSNKVGTATADAATGVYTITVSAPLADGAHDLTVTASVLGAATSSPSPPLNVIVDTSAPSAPPAPNLTTGSDTGVSYSDDLTRDTTPTITGTAEPGATVKLLDNDATVVATAIAGASGNYVLTSKPLTAGAHALTVTATDAAGNESYPSAPLNIVIDTTPGTAISALAAGEDQDPDTTAVAFSVHFNQPVSAVTLASFKLTRTGTASGTLQSVTGSGTDYTVTLDGLSGTGTIGVTGTSVTDLAGNPINVTSYETYTVNGTQTPNTYLVSSNAAGAAGTGASPSLSASGFLVAFNSITGSLVPSGAADGTNNVFVKNVANGAISLVSVGTDGDANASSYYPSLSADGTEVAFASDATNLVPGGTPAGQTNIYVASLASGSLVPGSIKLVSPGGTTMDGPRLSADGTKVSFESTAALVPGAETGTQNVYVEDIATGQITLVSGGTGQNEYAYEDAIDPVSGVSYLKLTPEASKAPNTGGDFDSFVTSISADGTLIAYDSLATDLGGAPIDASANEPVYRGYVYNLTTGMTTPIDGTPLLDPKEGDPDSTTYQTYNPILSSDGQDVFFATHEVLGTTQVQYLYKDVLATGMTTLVSQGEAGTNLNYDYDPSASMGGTFVLYESNPGLYTNQPQYEVELLNTVLSGLGTSDLGQATYATLDQLGSAYAIQVEPNGSDSDEVYETFFEVTASIDAIGTNDTLNAKQAAQAAVSGLVVSGETNAPAGSSVIVNVTFPGTQLLSATGTTDGDGHWSATLPAFDFKGGPGRYVLALEIQTPGGGSDQEFRVFTIATALPAAPPAPLVAPSPIALNGGVHNGIVFVNNNTPPVTGTSSASIGTVNLYDLNAADPAAPIASGITDQNGNYAVTPSKALTEGLHHLEVQITDIRGNVSAMSAGLAVMIDTTPPEPLNAPTVVGGVHTGITDPAKGDFALGVTDYIDSATVTLTGTAEPNSLVDVVDLVTRAAAGEATASADGVYTVTTHPLADGAYELGAVASDAAGNTGTYASYIVLDVDTQAPESPMLTAVAGQVGSDGDLSSVVDLTGTAEANSKISLQIDGIADTTDPTTTADSDGTFDLQTLNLPSGTHTLTVTATDAAGNVSPASAPDTVMISATPLGPPGTTPDTPTDTGKVSDGYISGATVFADANGNGFRDPGEAETATDTNGQFTLFGGSGELIATGGTDITTGLSLPGALTAPADSTVIDPLTTLVDAYIVKTGASVAAADAAVAAALGLPSGTDLTSLDPIAATLAGNLAAQVANAKLADLATDFTAALSDNPLSAILPSEIYADVFRALASEIAALPTDVTFDLDDPHTLLTAVSLAADFVSGSVLAAVAEAAEEVAAAVNTQIDAAVAVSQGSALLTAIASVETVAQGGAATALAQIAVDPSLATTLVPQYTGAPLVAAASGTSALLTEPPRLAPGSDLGVSPNDNITDDLTPTFVGTAPPGTLVALFEDVSPGELETPSTQAQVLATAQTDATGHYSITIPTLIVTGSLNHPNQDFSFSVIGSATNANLTVGSIITIPPETKPEAFVFNPPGLSDGAIITDATSVAAPGDDAGHSALSVHVDSFAADDTQIQISADGGTVPIATGSVDNSNPVALTTTPLSLGEHTLTVTTTLAGGEIISGSPSYTVNVKAPIVVDGIARAVGPIAGATVTEIDNDPEDGDGDSDAVRSVTGNDGAYAVTVYPVANPYQPLTLTDGYDTVTGLPIGGPLPNFTTTDGKGGATITTVSDDGTLISPLAGTDDGEGDDGPTDDLETASSPDPDLDPIKAAQAGDTAPLLTTIELLDTATVLARLVGYNLALFSASSGQLDSAAAISAAIAPTLSSSGSGELTAQQVAEVVAIAAAGNAAIDAHAASASNLADAISYAFAAERLEQIDVAAAVDEVYEQADDSTTDTLLPLVASYTGTALDGAIKAEIGHATQAVSLLPLGQSTTGAPEVTFEITFSEAVTGLAAASFQLVTGAGLQGAAITGVSAVAGSGGTAYDVAVSTGVGQGTLAVTYLGGGVNTNAGSPITAGVIAPAVTYLPQESPGTYTAVAVGDFNGDGRPDAALVYSNNYFAVTPYINMGDGTFRAEAPLSNDAGYDNAFSPIVADVNGDGKADILVADQDPNIVNGTNPGQTYGAAVTVLLGNGDGSFQQPINIALSFEPNAMVAGDFNGDGKTDLAVADTAGNVDILLGNGAGGFIPLGSFAANAGLGGTAFESMATGDFNGDGRLDLAVNNAAAGTVSILLGNGDGTFTAGPLLAAGANANAIAIGDFNHDGIADIAVANGASTSISPASVTVLLGKGDGTFTALAPFTPDPILTGVQDLRSIAIGDINNDGTPDLVVGGGNGDVSVLLGNGDGTFRLGSQNRGVINDLPSGDGLALADVDGDGRTDILAPGENLAPDLNEGAGLSVFMNEAETVVGSTSPSVTIDRPILAVPALAKASGAGTLTSVGNAYTLDLGTLSQGGAAAVALALDNTAAAPADSFDGLFSSPSGSGFTVTGAALAQAVAAGGSYGGLGVAADTSTPGSYSETITFAPRDVTAPVTTSVTVGDPADGDTTADATPNPDAVAKELSPITLTVTDTVVASGAPIAPAALAPVAPVVLPNVRVGAADSAALALTNAATAPAAGLDVTAVASGAASVSGAITGLTPGGTDSSDIVAGISTESAGALTGTVTLSPVSDASGVTTPLAAVGVTVSGSVFRPAAAQVAAVTAILHVGDAGTVALPVGNSDPADGFSENLIAAIASVTPGLTIAAGGPSADIAPGATDQSLTVTVSTAAAGTVSGTATLSLTSDGGSAGSGPDGLGALALAAATVPITATVDNDAQATLVATGATLTGSAASGYILDLGAVQQGSAAVSATLDTVNSAAGPADALAGSYAVATGVGLTDSGFAAFSGDGAGQADAGGSVTLQTGQVGAFSQTIVLHTTGSNASGYSAALADQTVTVEGTVVAAGTAVGSIATTPASLGVVPGAAATAIGITAPTDTAFDAGQLTITIGALPTDGTVMLADGTAVVAGEGLSALQLAGLHFIPAAGAAGVSSALTYAVSDPSGSTASGTATLAVLTAGSATAPQPPTLLLASPPGGPEAASPAAAKAISNDPTPPVVGVAADGAQVTLTTGGVAAGGSTADASTGAYGAALTTSLGLGVSAVTATAANSAGTSAASAPVSVYEIPVPVAGVSAPDISSVDVGALFDQGYRLQFAGGTEAAALVDGTVSVGPDTNEAYLQRLYEGLFGRSNDAAGMEFWDNLLTVGVAQYAIAADFMTTPEYRATFPDQAQQTDSQFVGQLYHGFLGRAPTAGDQAYWGGVADRYGRQYVLADVADSAEAKTALASTTAQVWGRSTDGTLVHELYETGLDREVELSGLAFWKNTLESNALTPLALAQTISTRPEFVALHAGQSDTSYVASLYEAGFGRAPDAAGAAFWGGLLAAGTLTRAGVLLGIATSGEAVADQTRNL